MRRSVQGFVGAALIAFGAQLSVPMEPVPMTLQTLAVLCVGGVWGSRVGAAAAGLYLLLGIFGLPVLAQGTAAGGAAFLTAKTFGYLAMFVPAGWIAGIPHVRPYSVLALMLAAHALILTGGAVVLSLHIGPSGAFEHGVQPFLLGALVKATLAAAVITSLRGVPRKHLA